MTPIRLALAAALLLPTAPAPQQPAAPTLKVDTKLTIVDVTVTDKYGHPVHGLRQSDFVIKEDGKPQPIKNFDEYGASAPTIPMGPKLPPDVYSNQSTPATSSATNIILLDNVVQGGVHADPQYLMYAKQQAELYLKSLPPGTPVAIMKSADHLMLLQDVTTDRDILLAAIHKVEFKAIPGVTLMPPVIHGHSAAEHEASYAGQARLTYNALTQIAAWASGIQGRKNLIWLTPGIPWLTNYSQFSGMAGLGNTEEKIHQLYATLNAAKVAIYTIDSAGLTADTDASTDTGQGESNFSRIARRESLQAFADATGGKAFYNRNDLDVAIDESVHIGSDYYTLAYTPPQQGYDGKYHSIDVKVSRPDLQLSYRKGYTSLDLAKLNTTLERDKNTSDSKTPQQAALPPAVSQFRAEMLHGAAPSTELLLAARITPAATPAQPAPPPIKGDLNPKVKPNPLIRYDVIYSLSAGQVTLSEGPDGTRKGRVEFDIVAYGEDGTKLNVLRQTANITLKPQSVADFQSKPFDVPLQFDLPPGKLFVRVGALDVLSGKAGTLEVPQTVAKP